MYGKIAFEMYNIKLPLKVLPSPLGWYIGTFDKQVAVSYESVEYWQDKGWAEVALVRGQWSQRDPVTTGVYTTMKLYIQDNGWRGCVVVLADNLEHAVQLIQSQIGYAIDPNSVEEHELVSGLVFINLGDE